jgi:hypothetical protein
MNDIRIEIIILIYTAICLGMIVFNLLFMLYLRTKDFLFSGKNTKMQKMIGFQIERVRNNDEIDEKIQEYLFKRLPKIKYLKAFHSIIRGHAATDEASTYAYLQKCRKIFEYLVLEFQHESDMKKTYLAFLISEFRLCPDDQYDIISCAMLSYTLSRSIYCRQNALNALYSSGNAEAILTAMKRMQEMNIRNNNKLTADGLLLYKGDKGKLAKLLFESFNEFDINTRVAIINFIKTAKLDYTVEFFRMLQDPYTNIEIKLGIIRYFGRFHYEPAGKYLVTLLSNDKTEWEYRAISASALAIYKSKEVIEALKKALSANNWYIRFNSSESLVAMDVGYMDLVDIYNGEDRYAREILEYKMETAKLKKAERKEKSDV